MKARPIFNLCAICGKPIEEYGGRSGQTKKYHKECAQAKYTLDRQIIATQKKIAIKKAANKNVDALNSLLEKLLAVREQLI